MFQKIKHIISNAGLVIVVAIGLLIAIPLFLLGLPFMRYRERKFDAAFQEYIRTQEGRRYFVYTDKKKIHEFVATAILPLLDKDIKIVYLGGMLAPDDDEAAFIQRLVRWERPEGGYPCVIEIKEGKPQAYSLNSAVYKTMQDGDAAVVAAMVNS